ncbi:MAG: sulfatase-like hydrolase/transferase [Chitinophagaceae bacterium]
MLYSGNSFGPKLKWKQFPWYLLLACLAFVLHGYATYPFVNQSGIFFQLLLEYVVVGYFILFLVVRPLKHVSNAGFVVLLLLCFNFYSGIWMDMIASWLGSGSFVSRQIFWIPLLMILLGLLTYHFRRGYIMPSRLLSFCNLLFSCWILIAVVQIIDYRTGRKLLDNEALKFVQNVRRSEKVLPDIHVIVLDEYAGLVAYERETGSTNSEFVDALRKEGFFVADSSVSNYNFTPYSVASLLRLDYLFESSIAGPVPVNYPFIFEQLSENRVFSIARELGYNVRAQSWFPTNAHQEISSTPLRKRIRSFVNAQTLLGRMWTNNMERNAEFWDVLGVAESNLMQFDSYNVELIENLKSFKADMFSAPVFTFTHLMMPHFPFYRNANSELHPVGLLKTINRENERYYVDYLEHTNKQILSVIHSIRQNSERPYSLLIVSDHGYRKWRTSDDLWGLYNNFFAWKSSNGEYPQFETPVSLVNSLRYLLNHELGGSWEYLPHMRQTVSY